MSFLATVTNFLHPELKVAEFINVIKLQSKEIQEQRHNLKNLFQEYKEEERWRLQYTSALSLLTTSMQTMVWQKDVNNKYILANPTHCEKFFGFDGTLTCLKEILGKTDCELIKSMFHKRGIQNTFNKICYLSDKYVIEQNQIVHFFESGIVEGIEVLLYIVKIPQYEDDELIGTMGIGWNFENKKEYMKNILNRWKNNDEIIELYKDGKTFSYVVEPKINRCELFHHICPIPCDIRKTIR